MRMHSIALAAALAGCAVQPVQISVPFDAAQARAMLADGSNTIEGSALIQQRGGGVVTCAGREVILIPATDYARARVTALYGNAEAGYAPMWGSPRLPDAPADYETLRRSTVCDSLGMFRFERIADGDWYVISIITWNINPYIPEGGALMRHVSVRGGGTAKIVLSPLAR